MGQERPLRPGGDWAGAEGKKGINRRKKITALTISSKQNWISKLSWGDWTYIGHISYFSDSKVIFLYCSKRTNDDSDMLCTKSEKFHEIVSQNIRTFEHVCCRKYKSFRMMRTGGWQQRAQIRKKNILQSFSIFSKRERKPSTEIKPSQMVRY